MQVNFEQMQIQKQIGEGSFGKVYLAKWKETTVAVKILTNPNGSSDDDFPTRLPNPLLQSLEKVWKLALHQHSLCLCATHRALMKLSFALFRPPKPHYIHAPCFRFIGAPLSC